jgi:hypothetical protein
MNITSMNNKNCLPSYSAEFSAQAVTNKDRKNNVDSIDEKKNNGKRRINKDRKVLVKANGKEEKRGRNNNESNRKE